MLEINHSYIKLKLIQWLLTIGIRLLIRPIIRPKIKKNNFVFARKKKICPKNIYIKYFIKEIERGKYRKRIDIKEDEETKG